MSVTTNNVTAEVNVPENCVAVKATGVRNECSVCAKNYNLNQDKQCETISPTNCSS